MRDGAVSRPLRIADYDTMLPYKRSQRVSHLLKEEVSDIIMNRVKDPRLGFLTVTDVDVTDDLKLARIYISILDEEQQKATLDILNSAKPFIRSELGKRVRMKFIPSIEFRLDTSIQYGARIDRLLKDIEEKS